MGKDALERWRAARERLARRYEEREAKRANKDTGVTVRGNLTLPGRRNQMRRLYPLFSDDERTERASRNARLETRVIAALIAGVPMQTIASDLRIPRRTVELIAQREGRV